MYELIPIASGIVAGAVVSRLGSILGRATVIAIVALAGGLLAGLLSHELEESWLFLAWDMGQAAVAAVLTLVATRAVAVNTRGT
jgi:hypothetical protein